MSSISQAGVNRIPTQSGTAIPVGGAITLVGAGGITTSAVGSTVTLTGSGGGGITTIDGDTGSATGATVNIIGGTGITTSASGDTLTIDATGTGFTWSIIAANQTAAVNHGYWCNKAGTLALALPATSAVGDTIKVININTALGWQITQAAGQRIFFFATPTTLGASGSLASTAVGDAIEIVCRVANTIWDVQSSGGNITVV